MTNKKLVLVKSEYLKSIFGDIDFIEQGNGNNIIGTLIHESDKGKCSVEFGIAGKLNNIILSGIPSEEVTTPVKDQMSIDIRSLIEIFSMESNKNFHIFSIRQNIDIRESVFPDPSLYYPDYYDKNIVGTVKDLSIAKCEKYKDIIRDEMMKFKVMCAPNSQYIQITFMHTGLDEIESDEYDCKYEVNILYDYAVVYRIVVDKIEEIEGFKDRAWIMYKNTDVDGCVMFRLHAMPFECVKVAILKICTK